MVDFVQKQVLDAASFSNTNSNASDAIKVRADAGSVVGNAIATAVAAGVAGAALPSASETVEGKIQIATQPTVTAGTNDTQAVTSLKLKALLDARLAALPADNYVSSMASYDAVTNIATFNLSGGGTTTVDFTALVSDAVAQATAGKVPVNDNGGVLVGYLLAV
jgi:hypothetical protein